MVLILRTTVDPGTMGELCKSTYMWLFFFFNKYSTVNIFSL